MTDVLAPDVGLRMLAERDHPAALRIAELADEWRSHPKRWRPGLRADLEALVFELGGSAEWLGRLRKCVGLTPLSAAELRALDERLCDRAQAEGRRKRAEDAERRRAARALPPLRVALVGCGKTKRPGTHPARDLYTGPLFRAALAHAERTADQVWIVSALHGLLRLGQEIESYDVTLGSRPKREREAWGERVASVLLGQLGGRRVELTILAGEDYASPIAHSHALRAECARPDSTVLSLDRPLRGLGVGERLRWFKDRAPRVERRALWGDPPQRSAK